MTDYKDGGIKKQVVEIKFLIHDLRVERFINEVIHFHVTLNTDLEIYSIEQAQILHGHDLQVLKENAVALRKAFRDYSNAVKNFSPDRTILRAGKKYVDTIRNTCALILNPLWGRVDNVLAFLPPDSRSTRSHDHYRNCLRWISGVSLRIQHFFDEEHAQGLYEEFDIATELEQFTHNVIEGYVAEESSATVELRLSRLDPALVGGNRFRLRRMYFNLVMNSVDAMAGRKLGVLDVSVTDEGDRVVLRVHDNGQGMSPDKIKQLLTDRESLDGELHSLGFVFVRQTIADFHGDLSIGSEAGAGTTVTISFPIVQPKTDETPPEQTEQPPQTITIEARTAQAGSVPTTPSSEPAPTTAPLPAPKDGKERACGQLIYQDFQASEAQYPGCIFAISVAEDGRVDFFAHRSQDRWWNMNHEDLSPMHFEATVRGRLEQDEQKRPVLTLKDPQSVSQYFDFKHVPVEQRSGETHLRMVRDEYVRIARKLIHTGLAPDVNVELAGVRKYFPGRDDLANASPFPLQRLAEERLSSEDAVGENAAHPGSAG